MENVTLYEYVRQTGLETRELVTILLGMFLMLFIGWAYRDIASDWNKKKITYNDLFGLFGGLLVVAFCFFMAYRMPRDRYLLREGVSRYTVAQVTKYGTRRGYRRFTYRYEVTGKTYLDAEDCGVSQNRALPCPPLGTRFYVQFSPEYPSVGQITQLEVPDSVRTVPPLGWERLPK